MAKRIEDIAALSVANQGPPIPAETQRRFLAPFARGDGHDDRRGLGLYIVVEIAKTLGGAVDLVSTRRVTRVTFRMPIAGTATK